MLIDKIGIKLKKPRKRTIWFYIGCMIGLIFRNLSMCLICITSFGVLPYIYNITKNITFLYAGLSLILWNILLKMADKE